MKAARVRGVLALFASAAGAQTFNMTLSGGREAGAAGGDLQGRGLAVVSIGGTTVRYYLWVKSIAQPTVAHIHSALAGQSGSVVVDLAPSFSNPAPGVFVATGSVSSDAATVQAILQQPNAYYVNVHNASFPAGAVRGQLLGGGTRTLAYAPPRQ